MKERKRKRADILSAVALHYEQGKSPAPTVTAKGEGRVAEEILRVARENDVPIREDKDLLELLAPLELGDEIPPELYKVVAELLAYLYKMNKKAAAQ